jgi:hypothetical protein
VPLVLAMLLLPVVVYCSLRAVAPRLGGVGVEHRRDIDAWHALMGTAMTAMLAGVLTRPLAIGALAVCAAGLWWGVLAVERQAGGAAHVRLVVGAGAMAVMTLPLAAPAMASDHESGGAMAGMSMAGPSPYPLVLVLLAGVLMVAAVRLPAVVRRTHGAVTRLDAGCDVVMATAMAAMLVALLVGQGS